MKTKSTGLTLQDLGNKSFTIKTPSNQINLHCLLVACGKSKSGKGFFITNLLHQLKQAGSMDRIFLVSDTAKSNKKMLERSLLCKKVSCPHLAPHREDET